VGNELQGKVTDITPEQAAITVEQVLEVFSGRWKLLILFHLFDGKVQRFSELERLIPGVSQKC
jgi:DNA-binding HxlR family transcriptional regulator